MALQEFFNQQQASVKKWPKRKNWLMDYTEGELKIFEDMIAKLITQKNNEIY